MQRRIDVDGLAIALHDLGGEGETMLIAHATGLCGLAYLPLAEELAGDFHCWAIDFRGHGESATPPDGEFDWTHMAAEVTAIVDILAEGSDGPAGPAPVHAFGHSMGGAALVLAEVGRPGLLTSMFLFEPIMAAGAADESEGSGAPVPNPFVEGARTRRASFPSRADALWRYASRPPLNSWRSDALLGYVEHGFEDAADGSIRLRCRPESEARTFECSGGVTLDHARMVRTPSMVARGRTDIDEPKPAMAAAAIAGVMPNAELVEYDHIGHFGPLEDPVTIGRAVRDSVTR